MTLDDCDELFAKFLELQSHSVRISILTELLSACHVLNVTLGRGSTFFWRGRKCTPEGYELQSDLWHPPAHITKPGRLNKAGAPVLYLSTNEETALAEVRAENGDYVHLIAYKLYPGKTLTINCIGEVEHLTRMGYLRVFGVDPRRAASNSALVALKTICRSRSLPISHCIRPSTIFLTCRTTVTSWKLKRLTFPTRTTKLIIG